MWMAGFMCEYSQARRLRESHDSDQWVQANRPRHGRIGPASALLGVVERVRIDEHFAESMVFPIVEAENGNYRTRGNQNANRIVNVGADARDADVM